MTTTNETLASGQGTWISGHALDSLLIAAKRIAYAEALYELGPKPINETMAQRFRADYDRQAKAKYPMPDAPVR